jgi:hypothetical protein
MELLQLIVLIGTIIAGVIYLDRAEEGTQPKLNCDYVAENPQGTVQPSNKCKEKESNK